MNKITLLVGALTFACCSNSAFASLIVSEWNMGLLVRDSTDDTALYIDDLVSMPFSETRTVESAGGTKSTAAYDFSLNNSEASFHFDYQHYRTGSPDSQNIAYADVFFTVSEHSSFTFFGLFEQEGTGRMDINVKLRDLTLSGTTSGFIYQNNQRSLETANQSFEIGGLDGDDANILIGDMSDILLPGHDYLMQVSFDIVTPNPPDNGASAKGYLDFSVISTTRPPSSVSAPSNLLLTMLGLFGLFLRRYNSAISTPNSEK